MPIKKLIDSRIKSPKDRDCAVVELDEVSAKGKASLRLSVFVCRVLSAHSRWMDVLTLVRSRADNLYFKRKL